MFRSGSDPRTRRPWRLRPALLPSLLISNAELEIFLDKFEQAMLAAGVQPV
jgi:hypothetical protein